MSDHSDAGSSDSVRRFTRREERAERRRARASRSSVGSSSAGSSSSKPIRRVIRQQGRLWCSSREETVPAKAMPPTPMSASGAGSGEETVPAKAMPPTPMSASSTVPAKAMPPTPVSASSAGSKPVPVSVQEETVPVTGSTSTMPPSSSSSQTMFDRSWWASLSPFEQARYRDDCNRISQGLAPFQQARAARSRDDCNHPSESPRKKRGKGSTSDFTTGLATVSMDISCRASGSRTASGISQFPT